MSFYKQNLEAFIQLLKQKPKLFTDSKRQELLTLIEPLPDDIETLSIAVASWYEKYHPIVDAQLDILNNWDFNKTESTTSVATARSVSDPLINPEINKQMLKNSIIKP